MNRSALTLPMMLLLLVNAALSQTPTGARMSGLSTPEQQTREQEKRNERDMDRRMNTMRDLENTSILISKKMADAGYREFNLEGGAKDRVMALRRIDKRDLVQYDKFLQTKNTGIFKLFPNQGCLVKGVIRVDGECSGFVPMSSSFSFRQKGYAEPEYTDIEFFGDEIRSAAFFTHGAMYSLGDVPIENVAINMLDVLVKFAPSKTFSDARMMAAELKSGIDRNGQMLSSHIKPLLNTTYALRSIAYRPDKSFLRVTQETPVSELRMMSLKFDARIDQVVVFRIIRQDVYGGLTIVWRQLSKSDAPKIKFSEDDPVTDFH